MLTYPNTCQPGQKLDFGIFFYLNFTFCKCFLIFNAGFNVRQFNEGDFIAYDISMLVFNGSIFGKHHTFYNTTVLKSITVLFDDLTITHLPLYSIRMQFTRHMT